MHSDKQVVVVGGGFTGALVAKLLEKKFSVTLIDTKDYYEYTPGILRALTNPEHLKNVQALHGDYLDRAIFIRGTVTKINEKNVVVDNKKIPFDYLVIATGCKYDKPFRQHNVITTDRGHTLRNNHRQLKEAQTVLIVGGGIVGVEAAGEIIARFPEKKVILIHSRNKLINTLCPRAIRLVTRWLTKKGVELVYEDRVTSGKGSTFTTKKGKKIVADFTLLCVGNKPNTSCAIKKDDKQCIPVDNQLRVIGRNNVFAGGDVTNFPEVKLAQNAERHARIIAENIFRTEVKKPLVSYKLGVRPSLIGLSKWYAIFSYKGCTFSGIIPALMKKYLNMRWRRRYK